MNVRSKLSVVPFALLLIVLFAFPLIKSAAAGTGPTRTLSWGANYDTQLGIGTDDETRAPVVVHGSGDLRSLSATAGQAMAIGPNGRAMAWGDDGRGQASGRYDDCCNTSVTAPLSLRVRAKAVAAGNGFSYAVRRDGSVVSWGDYKDGFRVVRGIRNVRSLAAGTNHLLALMKDGTVKSWGGNSWGQLGTGDTKSLKRARKVAGLSGVKAIAAGGDQSLALMSDGTVKRWGGVAATGFSGTRILVPTKVTGIAPATAISSGQWHSLVLSADGSVWAWGFNGSGMLGDGTQIESTDPVRVVGISDATAISAGAAHSLALLADGTVRAWGANEAGQLGDGTLGNSATPVQVMALKGVISIEAGDGSSYATQKRSEPVATVKLKVDPATEYSQQVHGSGVGYTTLAKQRYPVGAEVRYFAEPDARYALFTGWSGICSGTADCVATVAGDSTVSWSYRLLDEYRVAPDTDVRLKYVRSTERLARFTFEAKVPPGAAGTGFDCRLIELSPAGEEPEFTACRKGNFAIKGYRNLRPGRYAFEVRATNKFGADPSPERVVFKIKSA
ncbi:MAG TPA: hypothetical protein VMF31_08990 [Solirubrobacterales bacterium]|nr:hypothetical protein [Solirubrobacterales bacterium]